MLLFPLVGRGWKTEVCPALHQQSSASLLSVALGGLYGYVGEPFASVQWQGSAERWRLSTYVLFLQRSK